MMGSTSQDTANNKESFGDADGKQEDKVMVDGETKFVAVRKEVRSLSEAETERFVKALKRMMQNDNGPDTSEYLRIARYHGEFCAHRNEQFPAWHRAYLVEMEKAIQAADIKSGGDGKIALPYWDWTDRNQKDLVPSFIREEFPSMEGLVDDPYHILNRRKFYVPSERRMHRDLNRMRINNMVDRFFLEEEHFRAATSQISPNNIESPHDGIHMATGWPMTTVPYASFQPLFFLHHCNVDRQYEKYLTMHTDTQKEFEATQKMWEEQGRENLYEAWCEPFYLGKERFMPKDSFDTKKLGFVYDKLPPTPSPQQREKPIYAVFFNVYNPDLQKKSYVIHVFVQLKSDHERAPLPEMVEDFTDDKRYAGWTAIFGGRGYDCENCVKGDPVNYYVELNDALHNLNSYAYDVQLDVILFDEMYERVSLENAPGVPAPKIRGPWFTRKQHLTSKTENREFHGEAYMVQRYLKNFGWYNGEKDGWFGKKTEQALRDFQKTMGLTVDGIAGEITKDFMSRPRHDSHWDKIWQDGGEEIKADGFKTVPNYRKGSRVLYHIGSSPAYLKRQNVESDIGDAFDAWNDIQESSGVLFIRTRILADAQLRVQWRNTSPKNDRKFDGRGGMLAESTKTHISFDITERWLTSDLEAKSREFYLREVTAHEIGHVLGLGHINERNALMNPYYEHGRVKPTDHEIAALKNLAFPSAL